MRHLCFLSFIICLFAAENTVAQSVSLSGRVTAGGLPVAGATISLLNARDSTWIRSEMTTDAGTYLFSDVAQGDYLIAVTTLGYRQEMRKALVNRDSMFLDDIELVKEGTSLAEVSVTTKIPFMEVALGKIVINIEGSAATAASNVLDLMRRLPDVTIDPQDNIAMHGKQGVLVLIDERPTYLSGDDLAAYLKTITAEEIGQIEVISQPGAKYEAAGNTGVINIKLRKSKRTGFNGNAMVSYGQGVYFHRNESLLLNYKKNKLNLTISANDMEAIGFADWREQLKFLDASSGALRAKKNIHATPKERFSNTALRAASDYDVSDKTTVGGSARGTYHPNVNHGYIFSTISDNAANDVMYNDVVNADGFIRKDLVTNAYLSEKFSKESTLDLNVDYLTYSRNANQDVVNTMYNDRMEALPKPLVLHSQQLAAVNVLSFKADQACTLKSGLKLETGIKSSLVRSDNNAAFRQYANNVWFSDSTRSSHFLYKENINAAYAAVGKAYGKRWEMRAGLRAEQTVTSGSTYSGNKLFSTNYWSLFPTMFVSYKQDTNNQFEINYGRRIDRPSYKLLNPFIYYTFQDIYNVGNPRLQPQFTHNIELKHSYKHTLITTLTLSSAHNIMQGYVAVNDTTRDVYYTDRNIKSNNSAELSVYLTRDIFKWWALNIGGTILAANFTGSLNDKTTTVSWQGYSADANIRLGLGKDWKAELEGGYASKGRWSLTSSFEPVISFSLGLSKKFNEHVQAKIWMDDPFYIFHLNARDVSSGYDMSTQYRAASRLAALSFTYNFGSRQFAEHKTVASDEAKRLNIN